MPPAAQKLREEPLSDWQYPTSVDETSLNEPDKVCFSGGTVRGQAAASQKNRYFAGKVYSHICKMGTGYWLLTGTDTIAMHTWPRAETFWPPLPMPMHIYTRYRWSMCFWGGGRDEIQGERQSNRQVATSSEATKKLPGTGKPLYNLGTFTFTTRWRFVSACWKLEMAGTLLGTWQRCSNGLGDSILWLATLALWKRGLDLLIDVWSPQVCWHRKDLSSEAAHVGHCSQSWSMLHVKGNCRLSRGFLALLSLH